LTLQQLKNAAGQAVNRSHSSQSWGMCALAQRNGGRYHEQRTKLCHAALVQGKGPSNMLQDGKSNKPQQYAARRDVRLYRSLLIRHQSLPAQLVRNCCLMCSAPMYTYGHIALQMHGCCIWCCICMDAAFVWH